MDEVIGGIMFELMGELMDESLWMREWMHSTNIAQQAGQWWASQDAGAIPAVGIII